MIESPLTEQEYALFQRLIHQVTGISLSESKQPLLVGRLQKRLRHYELSSFSQYYRMITSGEHPEELQMMLDLITTNETYFFREPKHFAFLRDEVLPQARRGAKPFRVWSAASSSGEEAYSIAMVLADYLPERNWEIVGTDISTQVLEKARLGHYPLERVEGIPEKYLKRFCRKGVRSQAGTFLIDAELRKHVQFQHLNLTLPITASLGMFDVVFLRNVMIYFDMDTKRKVIHHLLPYLQPGGHLIIGHSETLSGLNTDLVTVRPTIYRKP